MLDIIIPSYNNLQGLYDSLFSLGAINYNFNIYIVDDSSFSISKEEYNELINFFKKFHNIKLLFLEKNSGPGVARNFGLKNSSSPWVMFLDCGDRVLNPKNLYMFLNDKYDCIFPEHLEEKNENEIIVVNNENNRLHGKIYKRSFLKQYDILFNEQCSYNNEDIGFNFQCRLFTDKIFLLDESFVIWTHDINSLVRKNNYSFFYESAPLGLAKNAIYAFHRADKFNIDKNKILNLAYCVLGYLYTITIGALNTNSIYFDNCINGAKYFFHNYFKYQPFNKELFVKKYNESILSATEDFFINIPLISFNEFIEVISNENKT